MEAIILKHAPETWDKIASCAPNQFKLSSNSEEFIQISFELNKAVQKRILISSIERNQNLYDYGQLLIREQLKINLYTGTSFYRVRRFIKIKNQFLKTALNYNVDHRRCGLASLEFRRQLRTIKTDETILAIQVITDTPTAEIIKPDNSSDYFIEYVIKLYNE